jgi:hypothetical protein
MKIGLIDCDNTKFPNIALMKISAWHKLKNNIVEFYDPMFSGHCDIVYISKVFSFSEEPEYCIDADLIIRGGTGYCISLVNGIEIFDKTKNINLSEEIGNMFPDYSIYGITDTAYGFMSRGCPRGCGFCHVKDKEGLCSYKVADLSSFWNGQKFIELMDPNTLACKDWKDILQQLIDSKAYVNFNQGVDIRLLTSEKLEYLKQIKIKHIHFAWDNYNDKEMIVPKFEELKKATGWNRGKVSVYVLCNFDTTIKQDLERIYFLRSLNFQPYVMLYDKENIPKGHVLKKMQRWCNNKFVFWSCKTLEEYCNY